MDYIEKGCAVEVATNTSPQVSPQVPRRQVSPQVPRRLASKDESNGSPRATHDDNLGRELPSALAPAEAEEVEQTLDMSEEARAKRAELARHATGAGVPLDLDI